jgi:hypothetical protein
MALIFTRCVDKKALRRAIVRTFNHRETEIPVSFEARANSFDLSIMRGAWPSVELMSSANSFEDTWREMMLCLAELDAEK